MLTINDLQPCHSEGSAATRNLVSNAKQACKVVSFASTTRFLPRSSVRNDNIINNLWPRHYKVRSNLPVSSAACKVARPA